MANGRILSAGSYRPDYLERGKQRLKEQASDALSKVKDFAIEGQDAVSAKTADLADAARIGYSDGPPMSGKPPKRLARPSNRCSFNRAIRRDSGNFTRVSDMAGEAFDSAAAATRSALGNPESRDKVLLGVAGLAVAAALGIACQRGCRKVALLGSNSFKPYESTNFPAH